MTPIRGLVLGALVLLGWLAVQGRTPLELIAVALIVLIVGGAVLVVVKLAGLVMPKGR